MEVASSAQGRGGFAFALRHGAIRRHLVSTGWRPKSPGIRTRLGPGPVVPSLASYSATSCVDPSVENIEEAVLRAGYVEFVARRCRRLLVVGVHRGIPPVVAPRATQPLVRRQMVWWRIRVRVVDDASSRRSKVLSFFYGIRVMSPSWATGKSADGIRISGLTASSTGLSTCATQTRKGSPTSRFSSNPGDLPLAGRLRRRRL